MAAEVNIPKEAWAACWNIGAPIPAEHDRVSAYSKRCVEAAAPLILAAELEHTAAMMRPLGDPEGDELQEAYDAGKAEACDVLERRARELRGEG